MFHGRNLNINYQINAIKSLRKGIEQYDRRHGWRGPITNKLKDKNWKNKLNKIKLMTNNPRKIELLTKHGINVSKRIPLIVKSNPKNKNYLHTKAIKSGHLL